MNPLLVMCGLFFLLSPGVLRAEGEVQEATFKVAGKCGMCKTRIEKALKIEGVTSAQWDKRTTRVTVSFQSPPLTVDSLQRRVAAAGHDTGKYTAPDSVYAGLPACCRYRDKSTRH